MEIEALGAAVKWSSMPAALMTGVCKWICVATMGAYKNAQARTIAIAAEARGKKMSGSFQSVSESAGN